jgi:hypothetical protein
MLDDETFVLLGFGDEDRQEVVDLGQGGPGNVGSFDEELYEPVSEDSWDPGERVGSVDGVYVVTPSGRAVVTLTMRFDGDDSLTATGSLRHEEGRARDGVMSITGGTGRFTGRRGELSVEFRNPHKYRATTST